MNSRSDVSNSDRLSQELFFFSFWLSSSGLFQSSLAGRHLRPADKRLSCLVFFPTGCQGPVLSFLLSHCWLHLADCLTFTAAPERTSDRQPFQPGLCVLLPLRVKRKCHVRCCRCGVCGSGCVLRRLLGPLCCALCFCHGFLRSPPDREAKCRLSRIAVHFHE